MEYVVSINDVSKKFKEGKSYVYALKDINIQIRKGEVMAILGPNGAGKTTLLNIMTGILYPDTGYVRLLGTNPANDSSVLERINIITAFGRYSWLLTGEQILKFYAMAYNVKKDVMQSRINELGEFFDIKNIMNRRFGYMSTGERMRLAFAKVMINNPELILLDEPTLGLDPDIAIKVRSEILRVNKEFGTTIILTSHYMKEVEQLADRIAFIRNGSIIDAGTVREVKRRIFSGYELFIEFSRMPDRKFLERHGFSVSGMGATRKVVHGESVRKILKIITSRGFEISDIETRKPTLEDYFVVKVKK